METHDDVFIWLLEQLAETTLEREQTVGINATTLEANAAMCRIVRRDTGDDYEAFVKCLAVASRVETLTRPDFVQFDRKRKKTKSRRSRRSPVWKVVANGVL